MLKPQHTGIHDCTLLAEAFLASLESTALSKLFLLAGVRGAGEWEVRAGDRTGDRTLKKPASNVLLSSAGGCNVT